MAECQLVDRVEACESLYRSLIGVRNDPDEERWALAAVSVLVEKLKICPWWKDAVAGLDFAVNNPSSDSQCIPFIRQANGGITLFRQEMKLHVISCRLWRWPKLKSELEVRSRKFCVFPLHSNVIYLCINPFHYERNPMAHPNYEEPFQANPHQQFFSFSNSIDSNFSRTPNSLEEVDPFRDSYQTPLQYDVPFSPPPLTLNEQVENLQSRINGTTPVLQSQYWMPNSTSPGIQEPSYWISFSYYELNTRVGNTFYTSNSPIQVDGYSNPPSNSCERLSLGSLSNPNRTNSVESTRKYIGDGLVIWQENGEIFVKCLCRHSIFIHCGSCNLLYHRDVNEVVKLAAGEVVKLFNELRFADLIRERVHGGYESIFQLTKLCIARISFVKGFGASYSRRDVTNTPCWIEVKFHRPLTWIDKVLTQMETPDTNISSVS